MTDTPQPGQPLTPAGVALLREGDWLRHYERGVCRVFVGGTRDKIRVRLQSGLCALIIPTRAEFLARPDDPSDPEGWVKTEDYTKPQGLKYDVGMSGITEMWRPASPVESGPEVLQSYADPSSLNSDHLAKLAAYADAHAVAREMGYPSLTEALEDLDLFRHLELAKGLAPTEPSAQGGGDDLLPVVFATPGALVDAVLMGLWDYPHKDRMPAGTKEQVTSWAEAVFEDTQQLGRRALNPIPGRDKGVVERLQRVASAFDGKAVAEVSVPRSDNPSPIIQPLYLADLHAVIAALNPTPQDAGDRG